MEAFVIHLFSKSYGVAGPLPGEDGYEINYGGCWWEKGEINPDLKDGYGSFLTEDDVLGHSYFTQEEIDAMDFDQIEQETQCFPVVSSASE
jgi:hypothetical protein